MSIIRRTKKGDTIIEVSIAITIFAMVAATTIAMMNSGIATAQGAMETSMARNEIDAQAEALRFIHDSYSAERSLISGEQKYKSLWHRLVENVEDNTSDNLPDLQTSSCANAYDVTQPKNIYGNHAFVINTRNIAAGSPSETVVHASSGDSMLVESSIYPRLVFSQTFGSNSTTSDDQIEESTPFKQIARAEGIWIIAIQSAAKINNHPQFYDFHIYTCWYNPGRTLPSTIGTIIRLYNPEIINEKDS